MDKNTYSSISRFFTCALILFISMSILIDIIDHVEKAAPYKGITAKDIFINVIGSWGGVAIAVLFIGASLWKKNRYIFNFDRVKNGIIGIFYAYLCIIWAIIYHIAWHPRPVSGRQTYMQMVDVVDYLIPIRVCLCIFCIGIILFWRIKYNVDLLNNKETQLVIPLMLGAIGIFPILFYICYMV